MSTPRDLIGDAFDQSGVVGLGQVAPASDVDKAYRYLNQIASQWSRKQWLPPAIPLSGLGGIDAPLGLTPDFDAALMYALAVRLRPAYQLPPDEALGMLADDALLTIRKTNVQAQAGSTPRDIITLALKVSGAIRTGQVAPVADVADAYTLLQQMMGQWARKRWLVPHLADVVLPLTGAASYSWGAGGDIPAARPDRIEAAFYRLRPAAANPLDYPLQVIDSREDWNRIALKSLRGLPAAVFYDSGFPLGTLYVYPVSPLGSTSYVVHLSVKDGVGAFAGLDAALNLAPEYEAALLYNLAVRLRPNYGLPAEASLVALALDSLNTIRKANSQVPTLRMPAGLPGVRGRGGAWQAGLGGVGGDPGFNQAQGFRVGISLLDGTDIAL